MIIPFNKPLILGTEVKAMKDVIASGKLSDGGVFYKACQCWFEKHIGTKLAVPTPSCTASLEMALMLADIQHGDEVILPSFTFSSTATAIVLHGGIPVFIDSLPNTFNINEDLIVSAITNKTKAIIPVHYGGISCNMEKIMNIAQDYNLTVVEDAAQCIGARDTDKQSVGSKGHMSAFSFHETKNITCGEGGVLCINDDRFLERAEIVRDKGLNRQNFFRGLVDKYSWQDKGSSYLMSELSAAFLYSQLKEVRKVTQKRRKIWDIYYKALAELERKKKLQRPYISTGKKHNAHLFSILLPDEKKRESVQDYLNSHGIAAHPHYVPLHTSVAGKKFGIIGSSMVHVEDFSTRLLRLPIYYDMHKKDQESILKKIYEVLT